MTLFDQISDPFSRAAIGIGSGTNTALTFATVAAGDPLWLTFLTAALAAFTPVLVAGIKQWVDKLTSDKAIRAELAAAEASKELAEATIRILRDKLDAMEKQPKPGGEAGREGS